MMVMGTIVAVVFLVLVIGLAIFAVVRSVRIVPQARAGIVERFGRYHRTLLAGLNVVVPFIDRLRPLIDLREQVVSFPRSRSSPGTTSWSASTRSSTFR
jgi:regulator of protease activity HflC (stomatin/prohibitin superfamily)